MGNSVLAWDLQFIERTVSLFNSVCKILFYHDFESFWRCDMQMCYLDYSQTSPQWPCNGDRRKWLFWKGGRYGEVGVLYDNFCREHMFFLC